MWEFMTQDFRDFGASEAEVKGFLDNYQRVEEVSDAGGACA